MTHHEEGIICSEGWDRLDAGNPNCHVGAPCGRNLLRRVYAAAGEVPFQKTDSMARPYDLPRKEHGLSWPGEGP